MSDPGRKTVVTVHIAGEEFAIRTDATDEYTRKCAEHVDRTIREIVGSSAMLPSHKASVLAALAITDQMYKAQAEAEALRDDVRTRAGRLSEDIARQLDGHGLATPS